MPRIAQSSIEELNQLHIEDVIGKHVELKKSGSQLKGKSPFTEEKTGSFFVHPAKSLWKCFSSGNGGNNAISFYMALYNLNFIEAVEKLAYDEGIELQREKLSPEKEAELKEKHEKRKTLSQILNFALSYFCSHEIPEKWIKQKQFKAATLKTFKVGFALDEWDAFYNVAKGTYTDEQLENAGLIKKSSKGNYIDVFRNRVMFPIMDTLGQVIAFSGRTIGDDPAKYLNSNDKTWNKARTLFGLNLAHRDITTSKNAHLVEGYTDVIRMHDKGIKNTVGSMSSSITEEQADVLRRITDDVTIVPDNDIEKCIDEKNLTIDLSKNAGIQGMHRSAEILVKKGLTVKTLLPSSLSIERPEGGKAKLPQSHDPDSWLQKLRLPDKIEYWKNRSEDYITEFLLRECQLIGESSPAEKAGQMKRMGVLINAIPDEVMRATYYDAICEFWRGFKTKIKLEIRKEKVVVQALEKMKKEHKEDLLNFGFTEEDNRYQIIDKGHQKDISNFKIELLFFIANMNESSKYVCKLTNIHHEQYICAFHTDDLSSNTMFRKIARRYGNFIWKGKEEHLDNISMKLFHGVKKAKEPSVMGWNKSGGFYTWANGILFKGKFFEADKYGVVTLKKTIKTIEDFNKLPPMQQIEINRDFMLVNDPNEFVKKIGQDEMVDLILDKLVYKLEYHFLPFATTLKMAGSEDQDDDYEFERKFRFYNESKELDFNTWAQYMSKVYGSNGHVGICFYIASIFRDIIFDANSNYFPILNAYGMPQSGKSKYAESLARMFGEIEEDGVNLESGSTETGIRRYMSSVSNGIIWLNEFKNTLSDSKFGMLKGIADGSGKITGRKTSGNQTKTYKPKSSAIICGQDIPTKDPALTSRCLPNDFSTKGRDVDAFNELKRWEKEGRTTHVTCELLAFRPVVNRYKKNEPKITTIIRDRAKEKSIEVTDRAVLNATSVLTPIYLLMEHTDLKFPFTWEEILNETVDRLKMQVSIQLAEDDVEKFFTIIAASKDIHEGEHYEIQREGTINILLLRLRAIIPFYRQQARQQGVTDLGEATLKSYLEKHATYMGFEKSTKFTSLNNKTSAIKMNYDKLFEQGVELKTKSSLTETVSNEQFFTQLINGSSKGQQYFYSDICATLTKHARSQSGDTSMNVIKEQIDSYLVSYIANTDRKFDIKKEVSSFTLIEKQSIPF